MLFERPKSLVESVAFGCAPIGLVYICWDLVWLALNNKDDHAAFGIPMDRFLVWLLSTKVMRRGIEGLVQTAILNFLILISPDAWLLVTWLIILYTLARVHGLLGRNSRVLESCSSVYALYRTWSNTEWQPICQFFDRHLPIQLPCQNLRVSDTLESKAEQPITPLSLYIFIFGLVSYLTCPSFWNWHRIENDVIWLFLFIYMLVFCNLWCTVHIICVFMLKSWTGAIRSGADTLRSIVIGLTVPFMVYLGYWRNEGPYADLKRHILTSADPVEVLTVTSYCLVIILLCAAGYWVLKRKSLKTRLDYFDYDRQARIFGPAAASSRKIEPFVDRASRKNAAWYRRYMSTMPRTEECIRLVRFVSFGENICCRIKQFDSIQRAPKYVALSYASGDPDDLLTEAEGETLYTIECNGEMFYTRPNLYDALTVFRDKRLQRWMWIDTMCIDQGSSDDRLAQVARMGQIYQNADEVLLWSGNPNPDLADAVKFYQGTYQSAPVGDLTHEENMDNPWVMRILGETEEGSSGHDQHFMSALGSILMFWRRTWCRRAWILQELTLARSITFYYGHIVLPWNTIAESMSSLRLDMIHPPTFRREMQLMRRQRLPYLADCDQKDRDFWLNVGVYDMESFRVVYLLYLLAASRGYICSDPRDKIFSIMGIVNLDAPITAQSSADEMHIVYDTAIEDLYYWTARYCILSCPHLTCLSLVARPNEDSYHHPSWVPNFDTLDRVRPLVFSESLGPGVHGQAGPEDGNAIIGPVLIVRCVHTDSVVEVCDVSLPELLSHECTDLGKVLKFCLETPEERLSGLTVAECLWRMLSCTPSDMSNMSRSRVNAQDFCSWMKMKLVMAVANRCRWLYKENGQQRFPRRQMDREFDKVYREFRRDHEALDIISDAASNVMQLPKTEDIVNLFRNRPVPTHLPRQTIYDRDVYEYWSHPFTQVIKPICDGRRLFRSRKGHIGMSLTSMRPDDEIFVLKGAKVPFVLRYKGGLFSVIRSIFPLDSQRIERDYNDMLRRGELEKPEIGAFNVVAEAYIHGLMAGERAEQFRPSKGATMHLI